MDDIKVSKKYSLPKDMKAWVLKSPNELELKTRQHQTVKKGSDQTPINYMIRASEHPITFLDERYNLQQLHLRGVLNPMITEAGWVWHFNGFDKTQRNQ